MNHADKEYASLGAGDFVKLDADIGEQFGFSSIHCIAFEGMQKQIAELQAENERLKADRNAWHTRCTAHKQHAEALEVQLANAQSCQASMQDDIDHLTKAMTDSDNVLDLAQALIGELNNEDGADVGVDKRIAKFITAYRNLSDWKNRDVFCHSSQAKLVEANELLQICGGWLITLRDGNLTVRGEKALNDLLAAIGPAKQVSSQPLNECSTLCHPDEACMISADGECPDKPLADSRIEFAKAVTELTKDAVIDRPLITTPFVERTCLTCGEPVSKHVGFKCPDVKLGGEQS